MQAYVLKGGDGPQGLTRRDIPSAPLAPHEVRVRVHAVALNHRDLTFANRPADTPPQSPCSDAAGEVVEIGSAVTRLRVGQRVMSQFFPLWDDGPLTPEKTALVLGGSAPGVLAQSVVLPASAWVALPAGLGYREAATLPCAGVTAWNALFGFDPLQPGDRVLTLGTGGVSLWALQLGRAAGLQMIVSSSDDAKLAQARQLGAAGTINYRREPDWSAAARALSEGRGVDRVIDTTGRETLGQSMAALRHGGAVAMVGGVTGWGGEINAAAMLDGALRLQGVLVGSRASAEALLRFVVAASIQPVIAHCYPFERAREAFEHLASQRNVGKIIIDLD